MRALFRTPVRCPDAAAGEILVCGRRSTADDQRLILVGPLFDPRPPLVAEVRLPGDVTGSIHVDQVEFDRGAVSHRLLMRLRVPF